jgi:uncharacterized protein YndB with AHSA1/START domain
MTYGTVKEIGNEHELRFERELPHPVDKVWAALTEPAKFRDWLAQSGEIELRVGGRVYLSEDGQKTWIESTVTAIDPPKLIEYRFDSPDWEDGGLLRWTLEPSDAGTRLVLTHRIPQMSKEEQREIARRLDLPEGWEQPASTLAGWHTFLDRLTAALDGKPVEPYMDAWKPLNEHYALR